jgi:hypothetical protein
MLLHCSYPGLIFLFEFDMTSGHILFVGDDICARVDVLKHVGYTVMTCACEVEALRKALVEKDANQVDAVLFQCVPEAPSRDLVSACRAMTHAPVVLFADRDSSFRPGDFDAVVPNLCDPREWISQLAGVIARRRERERQVTRRAS